MQNTRKVEYIFAVSNLKRTPSYCNRENMQKKLDFCFHFQHEAYINPYIECITSVRFTFYDLLIWFRDYR